LRWLHQVAGGLLASRGENLSEQERCISIDGVEGQQHAESVGRRSEAAFFGERQGFVVEAGWRVNLGIVE
jgi:hypothetical protein